MSTTEPSGTTASRSRAALRRLPVLRGILPVDRSTVPTDLIAGTTLAALGIPEVMGYAKIAGMPVVTGLYTILIPIAVFAVVGSSRHLVVGADSATAAILAAGLASLALPGSSAYVELAAIAAILTGVMLIVARLVRLGFLADFLSRSVLIGFLTGVGIQVAMGQVGGMLGITEASGGTVTKFVHTLRHLGSAQGATVLVSALVLVVIVGAKAINRRIPGALLAVVGSIVVSRAVGLSGKGVAILGPVPSGLPHLSIPTASWHHAPAMVAMVGAIVLVILAQSAATSRAYAVKYQERLDENLDLVGLGVANLAAGVSGAFVVNGSPTKTQMVDSAGGRSQISQLTTALVVLVVLVFLTGPLTYLPTAVLSTVVFYIGIELIDVAGMRHVFTYRKDEFIIAVITAVVVVVVGVEQGVVLAIILSLLDYVRRGYRPPRGVIAPTDGGSLHSHPVGSKAQAAPGLIIYRFGADLFYANATIFGQDVLDLADAVPGGWLCLDASAIGDIDYSGWQELTGLRDELHERDIHLVLADLMHPVHQELRHYGMIDLMGPTAVYDTLGDVIAARRAAISDPPDP